MNKRSFLKAITGLLAAIGFGVKAKAAQPEFVRYDGRSFTPWAPYMMLHLGERGCGKPAILLTEYPEYGAVAESRIVRTLDGYPVKYASAIHCGSCGKEVGANRDAIRHRDGRRVTA